MWKASFTSVLSVKKVEPLRYYKHHHLDDLLDAGVTVGVQKSSSYEGNFRAATSGDFKRAWEMMKNNNQSFLKDRLEGIERILKDDKFTFFDSLTSISYTEAYRTCQISPIPAR